MEMTIAERSAAAMERNLAVVGLGYVGLPVAAAFADKGMRVIGIDIDKSKVDDINAGRDPIKGKEPGLDRLIKRVVKKANLMAYTDFRGVEYSGYVIVCIDTPFDGDRGAPDYRNLERGIRAVGDHLKEGTTVIIESTVAPGTCQEVVLPNLERESGLEGGKDFHLAHCPERLQVGRLLKNLKTMNRVIGGLTPECAERARNLYQRVVKADLDITDLMTAEIVKTAENAYRDVNIAFANEVALISQELRADAYEVRRLVNKCPWRDMHIPGAGVGGHCLTKDGLLLRSSVRVGEGSMILEARRVNDEMSSRMFDLLETAWEFWRIEPGGQTIVVLGLSFLEESDDTRMSPTFAFIDECRKHDVDVRVIDPYVERSGGIITLPLEASTFQGASAIILMTRHSAFVDYDFTGIADVMSTPVIVDGRDAFVRDRMGEIGLDYYGIGKPITPPS